jgi:Rod binding domain-containing protein
VVNVASEPRWVREGSPQTRQAYSDALVFEEMLTSQLAQTMAATGGLGGGNGEGAEGEGEGGAETPGAFGALSAQALTQAIARDGGLGVAAQLTRAQATRANGGGAGPAVTGGTAA